MMDGQDVSDHFDFEGFIISLSSYSLHAFPKTQHICRIFNKPDKDNDNACFACPPVNQGFEPDESVENDNKLSPERESGEHTYTVHIGFY